jgi:hypothetical protein
MSNKRPARRPARARHTSIADQPRFAELRCQIEALIDALIVFLDATDAPMEDREDDGDHEPSLGAGEALPFSRVVVVNGRRLVSYSDGLDQTHWGERPADPAPLDGEWDVVDEGEADDVEADP